MYSNQRNSKYTRRSDDRKQSEWDGEDWVFGGGDATWSLDDLDFAFEESFDGDLDDVPAATLNDSLDMTFADDEDFVFGGQAATEEEIFAPRTTAAAAATTSRGARAERAKRAGSAAASRAARQTRPQGMRTSQQRADLGGGHEQAAATASPTTTHRGSDWEAIKNRAAARSAARSASRQAATTPDSTAKIRLRGRHVAPEKDASAQRASATNVATAATATAATALSNSLRNTTAQRTARANDAAATPISPASRRDAARPAPQKAASSKDHTRADTLSNDDPFRPSAASDDNSRDEIYAYANTSSVVMGEVATFTCFIDGLDETPKRIAYQWYFSDNLGKKWTKSHAKGSTTNITCTTLKKNRVNRLLKCVVMLNGTRLETEPVGFDLFDEDFEGIPKKKLGNEVIRLKHVTKQYHLTVSGDKGGSGGGFLSRMRHSSEGALKTAVNDVSFSIRRGESVALIGLNGAGKSTVLKMIAGVVHPTSGQLDVRGKVSALLELNAGFDSRMTGRENIRMRANYLGYSQKHIDRITPEIIEFSGLGPYIDQPIRLYSSGMKSRLGFAFAVAIEPEILIIDETLAVGDKAFKAKCRKKLAELASRDGVTVLLVTHSSGMAKKMCNRGIVLAEGSLIYDGAIEDAIRAYNDQAAQIAELTAEDDELDMEEEAQ